MDDEEDETCSDNGELVVAPSSKWEQFHSFCKRYANDEWVEGKNKRPPKKPAIDLSPKGNAPNPQQLQKKRYALVDQQRFDDRKYMDEVMKSLLLCRKDKSPMRHHTANKNNKANTTTVNKKKPNNKPMPAFR